MSGKFSSADWKVQTIKTLWKLFEEMFAITPVMHAWTFFKLHCLKLCNFFTECMRLYEI